LQRQLFGIISLAILLIILDFSMTNLFGKAQLPSFEKRKAVFAGTWYEADGQKLRAQLQEYMQLADENLKTSPFDQSFTGNTALAGNVLAAIAPHAGYMFSGRTAAFVYDKTRDRKINRVFILGPSHYVGIHGLALPAEKTFATPLGDLNVDTDVVSELADFPLFETVPEVHRNEHSLEMQLPFIKQSFGNASIVPIIVGTLQDEMEIRLVGQILRRYVGENDLVIVSSDFTHYGPRYDYEPYLGDLATNVRGLDQEAFRSLQQCNLRAFIDFRERTRDTICGFYPCAVLLAMLPTGTHATLLNYRTSRDSLAEDDRNSVSYLAVVFSNETMMWRKPEGTGDNTTPPLSEKTKSGLLKLARQTLSDYVTGSPSDSAPVNADDLPMWEPRGVFVTLYKNVRQGKGQAKAESKELRGCIGYIWPIKPLAQSVSDNVIGACSRDPRFPPVIAGELNDIQIDINVLTPLHRVNSYRDIVVGHDGVVMYKSGRQAVFLPSVATDFGWTLDEMLSQLSVKAGCGADGWRSGARFDVFQAESFEESLPAIHWPNN
jgi:MEMO1 family protein